jgi:hypothetical protein
VNAVTTYYVGGYYEQSVDGAVVTERKYYMAGSTTIAMRTSVGETDTLNWLLLPISPWGCNCEWVSGLETRPMDSRTSSNFVRCNCGRQQGHGLGSECQAAKPDLLLSFHPHLAGVNCHMNSSSSPSEGEERGEGGKPEINSSVWKIK